MSKTKKFYITSQNLKHNQIIKFLNKLIKAYLYLPDRIIIENYTVYLLIYNYIITIKRLYEYRRKIDSIIIKSFLDRLKYDDSSIIIYSNYIAACLINLFKEKYNINFNLQEIIYFKTVIRATLKKCQYDNTINPIKIAANNERKKRNLEKKKIIKLLKLSPS